MIILPCFVFGCFSAVHGWNCYSHLLTHVGRRLAAVPVTGYFDDFQIYGTPRDCASAQYTLGAMFEPLIGFDLAKHMSGDQIRVTLGVRCDFSRVPLYHSITMEVTEERKAKLSALLQSYIDTGSITEAEAGRLYGKSRFVICPRFGRVYLAALQPLHKIHGRAPVRPGGSMHDCLTYLLRVVEVLRPVTLPIFPVRSEEPVVVLTDASFKTSTMTGELGVVAWCPRLRKLYYSSAKMPRWMILLFLWIQTKLTYICQAELVAALCFYLTFPELARGRLMHHFVDNDAAKSGLIKGTSASPNSSRILLDVHVQMIRLQCDPWFGFVYSEDNISDLPSRGDFTLMESLGAEFRTMVFPQLRGYFRDDI